MPAQIQGNTYLERIKGKISNASQLGGIETFVADNGAARGTRVAWINTGTGLRYKVVIDRAMDIADAFYSAHSLAWISHVGITAPQPFANKGIDWLRTFFGGLLTTCGLSHVGGPESDEHGDRGIHGNISNIPAELESIIQPDPLNGKTEMSITGVMRESKIFGPSLELRRTISGNLGEAYLHIHDEVTNRGNTPAPHMLLYHINFGFPLADQGSEIFWNGKMTLPDREGDDKIFNDKNDFHKCPAPIGIHKGTGEAVAFIDPVAGENSECVAGIYNKNLDLAVQLTFNKKQLPWLTNWQHWGEGEYVTGIEPGTHPPIGQAKARKNKELIFIQPGEKKIYDVRIEVLYEKNAINKFVNRFKDSH
ncbi:MAG: aldose 1-epimerase family protein [Chitinophagaceae bacterium]|nr:aldose 1-epimerase family protein [Chitinophagaceae bacterium]